MAMIVELTSASKAESIAKVATIIEFCKLCSCKVSEKVNNALLQLIWKEKTKNEKTWDVNQVQLVHITATDTAKLV
ncbi:unnamed protein product [Sphenostylis stenocarpa]|uniref:Uncharacterized protein n=1 Tax=Sphenostylis stenocarpa TaxID=92480 RepID=A0AA86W5V1_9FABA|nr:unnamed protein product [Sphenostylis stenocarpa]